MSGPKCGQLSFDIEVVRRSLQAQASVEQARLEALDREVAELADSPVAEAKRRELERLKTRQTERERINEELRQLRNSMISSALALELTGYANVDAAFTQAIAQRGALEAQFPGIALPAIPPVPLADLSNLESARQARQSLLSIATEYQAAVDAALEQHRKLLAAHEALVEIQTWMGSFKTRAVRSARDIVQLLDSEALHVASRAQDIRLRTLASAAARMVEALPQADEFGLSDAVLEQLDQVMTAENESGAQIELERLRHCVAEEDKRHTLLARERAQTERQNQVLKKRMETVEVAHLVANTLEDLGYAVSGIDETVFVRDGHLYALSKEWPDHAVRFEFDPAGQNLRAVPARLEQNTTPSEAHAREDRADDQRFDTAWCSAQGLGELGVRLKERGIDVRFERNHAPGTVLLERIPEQVLGPRLIAGRHKTDVQHPNLRYRTHDK